MVVSAPPGDGNHRRAREFLRSLKTIHVERFTTNFVFDETYTWFRGSYEARRKIGRAIRENPFLEYVRVTEDDERAAWELGGRLRDKGFSFTDLTSFVIAERLKIRHVFTFDGDFRRYGKFISLP
ncbi:MAG: hypothetical protein A2Z34_04665 [Planctomycetes bacterium RBG_16_59_8]|nr:MAG: hypothetical protein A2Z34_04665 [Planctomycetes bacterium RBG_16_59_8]